MTADVKSTSILTVEASITKEVRGHNNNPLILQATANKYSCVSTLIMDFFFSLARHESFQQSEEQFVVDGTIVLPLNCTFGTISEDLQYESHSQ